MSLEHRTENGVDLVQLPARLVMANAAEARTALKAVIEAGDGRIVIDLGATDFMDSSGLGVVVAGLQGARKKGGDIYLARMNGSIRALFELTKLHTIFQIFDDTDAAVAAFG